MVLFRLAIKKYLTWLRHQTLYILETYKYIRFVFISQESKQQELMIQLVENYKSTLIINSNCILSQSFLCRKWTSKKTKDGIHKYAITRTRKGISFQQISLPAETNWNSGFTRLDRKTGKFFTSNLLFYTKLMRIKDFFRLH